MSPNISAQLTSTPAGPSPLHGSGVPTESTQPSMVEQLAGDIETKPAVEQPEGENVSDTLEVGDVTQNTPSGGSSVADEGDGLKGSGWLAQHDVGDREVHDDPLAGDGVPDDLCGRSDVPLDEVGVQGVQSETQKRLKAFIGI